MKHKEKKHAQLGMNPSTASARLLKDILWQLILDTSRHHCCKCEQEMTRETFSIEHIVPWIDSEEPLKLFFDLENISFSHLSCNIETARKRRPAPCGTTSKYRRGCRCTDCFKAKQIECSQRVYNPYERAERYQRLGT